MKATGQMLKQRREALKISIAEVSISTKITSRMLQAIEAGNMDLLPARTFLRGFVKSYATYLKMDLDEVLKSFNEDMAALEPAPVPPVTESTRESAPAPKLDTPPSGPRMPIEFPNFAGMVKKAALGLGLVGLVGLIVIVYQLVQKYEREGQLDEVPSTLSKIESEPAKDAEPPKAAEKTPEPDAKTADVKPPAETKPEVVEKPVEIAKPVEPTIPIETPKPAAIVEVPKVEPKPTEVAKPAPPPEPVAVVAPPPAATPSGGQEIIIEALDKVDISFRVDNGQQKHVSMQPDQVHTIKATGVVAIEMSDGGAVNIIHNGRDVGVPGDLGRPKKIQLP
jgi:cytoskeleton protein RodZ